MLTTRAASISSAHPLWPALALGVVQGLTEFLPVSSSGHLVVGAHLLEFVTPSLLFDVLLHVGTLLPVVWYYRADLWAVLVTVGRLGRTPIGEQWRNERGLRLLVAVAIGTLPTAVMGATLNDLFERLFSSPRAVGVAFLVTGGILMLSRLGAGGKRGEGPEPADSHLSLTPLRALLVGVAQGCAITPGISRSGTTITACLLLGIERTMAARFSFLLSIPAILGAVALHLREVQGTEGELWGVYLAGTLLAAATGYLALRWLVHLVRRGAMHRFSYYLWPLGVAVLVHSCWVA
jgi:undecaprenyl-diphosphatase